jgi:hypothetical protein
MDYRSARPESLRQKVLQGSLYPSSCLLIALLVSRWFYLAGLLLLLFPIQQLSHTVHLAVGNTVCAPSKGGVKSAKLMHCLPD